MWKSNGSSRSPRAAPPLSPLAILPYPVLRCVSNPSGSSATHPSLAWCAPESAAALRNFQGGECPLAGRAGRLRESAPKVSAQKCLWNFYPPNHHQCQCDRLQNAPYGKRTPYENSAKSARNEIANPAVQALHRVPPVRKYSHQRPLDACEQAAKLGMADQASVGAVHRPREMSADE